MVNGWKKTRPTADREPEQGFEQCFSMVSASVLALAPFVMDRDEDVSVR